MRFRQDINALRGVAVALIALYIDSDRLSARGSRRLSALFRPLFDAS
jgi:hypothetical protein